MQPVRGIKLRPALRHVPREPAAYCRPALLSSRTPALLINGSAWTDLPHDPRNAPGRTAWLSWLCGRSTLPSQPPSWAPSGSPSPDLRSLLRPRRAEGGSEALMAPPVPQALRLLAVRGPAVIACPRSFRSTPPFTFSPIAERLLTPQDSTHSMAAVEQASWPAAKTVNAYGIISSIPAVPVTVQARRLAGALPLAAAILECSACSQACAACRACADLEVAPSSLVMNAAPATRAPRPRDPQPRCDRMLQSCLRAACVLGWCRMLLLPRAKKVRLP